MRKIFSALIFFAILVLSMQFIYHKSKDQKDLPVKAPLLGEQNNQPNIEKLGFIENFAANIVAKLAQSDKGSDFILKLIKPLNSPTNEVISKTNNYFYINYTFDIRNFLDEQLLNSKIAYCGSTVIVDYSIFQNNKNISSQENQRIILGEGTLPLVLENIVIGMHEGQTRSGKMPYPYIGNNLKSYIQSEADKMAGFKLKVKLKQVLSPVLNDIKIFDDSVSRNPTLLCGYPVSTKVRIRRFNNQILWEGSLNYSIGSSNYPVVFSYSLFNKLPEAARTVLSPAKYLDSSGMKNFVFEKDQEILKSEELVIIDFPSRLH